MRFTSPVQWRSRSPRSGCARYARASSSELIPKRCAVALDPSPRSWGKMNHIQWLCLWPAASSAHTWTNTGSCAATKRSSCPSQVMAAAACSALAAEYHREAVRLADHLALVGDELAWVIGPAQHIAGAHQLEAVLLEIAPGVLLIDAMQRAGIGTAGTRFRRMVYQQQDAAAFEDPGDLGEDRVRIDVLRPGSLVGVPVEIVIDLDEEDCIERVRGQSEVLDDDSLMHDIG